DPGTLAQVARARSGEPGAPVSRQLAEPERHLYRLRLARPIPHPLRLPDPLEAPAREPHRARLRGIRRQPFRHRLPDGRVIAVSLQGLGALSSPDGGGAGQTSVIRVDENSRARTGPPWESIGILPR